MLGDSQQGNRGRFVFPIIGGLLVIIAFLFLLSSRGGDNGVETVASTAAHSAPKSPSMGIADKIIVPLAVMTMPFRGVEKMIGEGRARSDVYAENARLKARLSQLSDAEMRANALAMKIKRFETLLSADVGLDIPAQKIAGRVVSENNGPFARSALLNVGTNAGVRNGHAVMTEQALYGHIVAVGKRSSRVLLLEDINSRIAVMSPRSEARAIMVGTNTVEPKLLFVARDADWKDGDVIVTSGDEGVLPRGLPVGVMKQRGADKRGVVLSSLGQAVDWVWVYPFEPIQTPEQDSAQQDIADKDTADENEMGTPSGVEVPAAVPTEDG